MTMVPGKIQLKITGVTGEGAGVGRLDGQAVFVPGALPGELVSVSLIQRKKNFAQGRLLTVDSPALQRQAPACAEQERCGGCVWQHCSYQAELEYKRDTLRQALRRIGGLSLEPEPVWGAAQPAAYRERVVWHVSHADGLKLGFYQQRSHSLCACDCLLLRQPLAAWRLTLQRVLNRQAEQMAALRGVALRRNHNGGLQLVFICEQPLSDWDVVLRELAREQDMPLSVWENSGPAAYGVYGAQWRLLAGQELLPDQVLGKKLLVAPGSFQQVNRAQAERLYNLALTWALPATGGRVLDLYAGLGIIGLLLADRAEQVVSVESFAPAAAAARRNRQLNRAENLEVICAPAEQALPQLAAAGPIDGAILDPPRAGCAPSLLAALAAAQPQRIVYVSCDPATLARDLRQLAACGYQALSAQPIDMFSRTGHVETVVRLERTQAD